jgi:hypothetical protein
MDDMPEQAPSLPSKSILYWKIEASSIRFTIGILALTHTPLFHILDSLQSDFYHDWEAGETTLAILLSLAAVPSILVFPKASTKQ